MDNEEFEKKKESIVKQIRNILSELDKYQDKLDCQSESDFTTI